MTNDPRFLPPTPFARLVATHALSVCGDACIAASLAGSLFFQSPAGQSREKVLLYLVLTLLPFAVIAPLLGPVLDRSKGGRRLLIFVSMVGRGVLCFLMSRVITQAEPEGLLVYPLAFGVLVLAKSYSISKSSLVPALVGRDGGLVRANSRLAIISGIATMVGGAPALFLQWVFDADWSLVLAMFVFFVAAVFALKIPRVQVEQDAAAVELENEELHQPSILLAGSAMAFLRGAVGFLTFFAAFTLKEDLFGLGVVAAMAVTGSFVGNLAAPRLRGFLREEQILASALLVTASMILIASTLSGALALACTSLAVGVGAAGGKLGFDSLLQRDGPDAARGRAFARFETRFQVAWVIGALVGIMPIGERVGLLVLAATLGFACISYVAALRAARGRVTRTTIAPEAVDRAFGRAKDNVRRRVRARSRRRGRPPAGRGTPQSGPPPPQPPAPPSSPATAPPPRAGPAPSGSPSTPVTPSGPPPGAAPPAVPAPPSAPPPRRPAPTPAPPPAEADDAFPGGA
jgi:hypothetical protein